MRKIRWIQAVFSSMNLWLFEHHVSFKFSKPCKTCVNEIKKELNEIALLRSDHVQECLHKCSQTQIWLLTATKLWTISWIRQNNFIVWYYNVYRVYRNRQRNVQNHVILWIFVWREFDLYQVNSFLEKNGLFLRGVCELNYCNNGINSQIDKGTEKLDHFEGRQ